MLLSSCGGNTESEAETNERKELFCIYGLKHFQAGVVVRICPRFCFCGESISKNAFRWFEFVYRPEMPEMHLQNFEKL